MKWPLVQLNEIAKVTSGNGAPQESSSFGEIGTPLIRAGSLASLLAGTPESCLELIPENEAKRMRMRIYPPGTVIFAKSGMSCLKGLVYQLRGSAHVVNHLAALECGSRIDPRFLLRWFELNPPSRLIANSSYPSIKLSDIRAEKIPRPPLAEQQRIAAILDAADALRTKRREALAQLDVLLQSTFLDLFGDPVLNPMGWDTPTVKKTNSIVQIGPFGSLLHKEDYVVGGVSLINPKHIRNGGIIPSSDETVSTSKFTELSAYQLCQGDVIMARRGEMGRCAVIDAKTDGLLCGTGSLFIRPNAELLHPIYLLMVLSSVSMRKYLEKVAWGVTMANLNRSKVEKLHIPLPPLDLQRRFATIVAAVERQKAWQRAHLAELDTLFAALQHRAFAGEL